MRTELAAALEIIMAYPKVAALGIADINPEGDVDGQMVQAVLAVDQRRHCGRCRVAQRIFTRRLRHGCRGWSLDLAPCYPLRQVRGHLPRFHQARFHSAFAAHLWRDTGWAGRRRRPSPPQPGDGAPERGQGRHQGDEYQPRFPGCAPIGFPTYFFQILRIKLCKL